jgi:hypothetical protein
MTVPSDSLNHKSASWVRGPFLRPAGDVLLRAWSGSAPALRQLSVCGRCPAG